MPRAGSHVAGERMNRRGFAPDTDSGKMLDELAVMVLRVARERTAVLTVEQIANISGKDEVLLDGCIAGMFEQLNHSVNPPKLRKKNGTDDEEQLELDRTFARASSSAGGGQQEAMPYLWPCAEFDSAASRTRRRYTNMRHELPDIGPEAPCTQDLLVDQPGDPFALC